MSACHTVHVPAQAWVTLIVGGLATISVIFTWRQKNDADRRSEWWRRAQWAFERTFSDTNSQAQLGWAILATMMRSKLVTADDGDVLQVVAERMIGLDGDGEDGDARRRNT